MTMVAAGFAYAMARLHARLAARRSESEWQQLEASLDFAHALEMAGRGASARTTRQLTRESDVHEVEAALRQVQAADLAEIAAWLPPRWRDLALWLGQLPYLRAREAAAADGTAPDWFDPGGVAWADAAGEWRAEWVRRCRKAGGAGAISAVLAPLLERFLGDRTAKSAPKSWAALERHFLKAFRAGQGGPAGVFAFLGLLVLDNERLRGILVVHAVFAGGM